MEIQAAIVLVLVFFLMLAMNVPVSLSIISASLLIIVMFLAPGFGMLVSTQKIISGIDNFILLAAPFFVLAGPLMGSSGIAKRLINLAMLFLGKVPDSLAMTNMTGNITLGSISGSGTATITAIKGVMFPLEEERGYDKGFSAAVNVATTPVGRLTPPTASFIICSVASDGVSVTAFLTTGWVPRLLWATLRMVVAYVYGAKHGYVMKRGKMTAAIILKTIQKAIPSLFLTVVVTGGILSGHLTPTEASGMTVVYAFLLSVSVYKSIQIKDISKTLVNTAVITTIVMLIIGASSVLSSVLSFIGLPQTISSLLLGTFNNRIVILLIVNITLLIMGTFMGMVPALLIFTPTFLPIVRSLGMDPIRFGAMIVMNLSIGTITSSVGNVPFVGCSVAKLQVEDVTKKLPPFFPATVAALMFITLMPGFSMWLPDVLGLLKQEDGESE